MFLDRSISLSKVNYFDMLQKLAEADIVPTELQGQLKIGFPDQSCESCRRGTGQCVVKPQISFLQNLFNSTRSRTEDGNRNFIL